MKFSPDVDNNPSNPYIQRKQNKLVQKLNNKMECHREKVLNYWNVFNTLYKNLCW